MKNTKNTNGSLNTHANTNENLFERMRRRFQKHPLASTIKAIGLPVGIIFLVLGVIGLIPGISVGASFLSLLTSTAGVYSMLAIGSLAAAGIASGYIKSQEKNYLNDYLNERAQKLAQLERIREEKEAAIATVQEALREKLKTISDTYENRVDDIIKNSSFSKWHKLALVAKEHNRAQKLAQLTRNIAKEKQDAIIIERENTPIREQMQTAKDTLENKKLENNTITLPRQNPDDMTK